MTARSWSGLLLGVGVAVGAIAWWWGPDAAPPGAAGAAPSLLRWDASEPRSFDLRVESLALGLGGGAQRSVLEGVLTLVDAPAGEGAATSAPAGRVRLTAQLSDVRQVPAAPSQGLTRPFELVLDREGRVAQVAFSAAVPAQVRGRLEELVRLLEFVVPAAAGSAWEASGSHTLGAYRARYVREGAALEKRKLAYLDPQPGTTAAPVGRMHVLASEAEATLSPRFWLEQATVSESVELALEDAVALRFDVWASLVQQPHGPVVFPLVESPAAPLPAQAAEADEGRVPVAAAPPADSRERFEAALAALRHSNGRDIESYLALKAALHDDPGLTADVLALLRAGAGGDGLEATLVLALERVGHAPAQEALVTLAHDPEGTDLLRLRAVVALGGLDVPLESLPPALWDLVRQRPVSSELADTATLALGSIARRLRERDPAGYAALRGELVGALAGARQDGQRAALLLAIGNASDPHFADYVAWWMEAGTTTVRAAAASALGRMGEPGAERDAALGLLVAALPREDEPRVREAIARSIARMDRSDPEAIRVAAEELGRAAAPEADYRLASYLVGQLPEHPEVRPALQAALARTTSRRLRDLLLRSL